MIFLDPESVTFLVPLIRLSIIDKFLALRCLCDCFDKMFQSIMLKIKKKHTFNLKRPPKALENPLYFGTLYKMANYGHISILQVSMEVS